MDFICDFLIVWGLFGGLSVCLVCEFCFVFSITFAKISKDKQLFQDTVDAELLSSSNQSKIKGQVCGMALSP